MCICVSVDRWHDFMIVIHVFWLIHVFFLFLFLFLHNNSSIESRVYSTLFILWCMRNFLVFPSSVSKLFWIVSFEQKKNVWSQFHGFQHTFKYKYNFFCSVSIYSTNVKDIWICVFIFIFLVLINLNLVQSASSILLWI